MLRVNAHSNNAFLTIKKKINKNYNNSHTVCRANMDKLTIYIILIFEMHIQRKHMSTKMP